MSEHQGAASGSQDADRSVRAAALKSGQNKRHRRRVKGEEAQTETDLERLTAAVAAARRERAALDAAHGALVSTEIHQQEILQAAQMAAQAGEVAGEQAAPWRAAAPRPLAAPGLVAGFLAAVGGWSQRAAARVKSLVREGAIEVLIFGGYDPTAADIRDYLLVCDGDKFMQRMARNQDICADLLAQWQSGAENVSAIETGVRRVCSTRARIIPAMARHRPDLVIEVVMARTIPAPPGGVQAAYPGCRQLHPSLQFLADLEWSEAQREALRPMWALYQEQVASCRALAQPHLRGLQTNTAAAAATWAAAETLPQLMGSYTGVFGNTAGLDAWLRLEAIAWADLAAGLFAVVTPYQAISIIANCRPHFADHVQIVAWVVEGGERTAAGSTTVAEASEEGGGDGLLVDTSSLRRVNPT